MYFWLKVVLCQVIFCRVRGRGAPYFWYSILQNLGDMWESLWQVLFYVANKFLWFDLTQYLCSKYYDIRKIGDLF